MMSVMSEIVMVSLRNFSERECAHEDVRPDELKEVDVHSSMVQ